MKVGRSGRSMKTRQRKALFVFPSTPLFCLQSSPADTRTEMADGIKAETNKRAAGDQVVRRRRRDQSNHVTTTTARDVTR